MTTPLHSYRGYFIDGRNHVRSIAVIEASDEESACAQAEVLLANSTYRSIEIWDGAQMIARRASSKRMGSLWPFGVFSRRRA